jgi:serine/threonine protein kinase
MEPETIIKQALKGKYKILEVIGKGGMATVYRAIQSNLNRQVAIKVIHQNMVHDEEFIKRFKREAQVCSSINHTNIVTVYDVGSIGTVHFMSMEYLEGMTLREIIKVKGPLSPDDTARYLSPIAYVLGIINSKGIVHRDVKSSNIFITNTGRAVLMDFGVVFSEGREPLSIKGSILGTPEYMSPEQAEGKLKVDGRSDIYSLGVVAFECITGSLPFHSDNYITTLYNVLNEQPPSISSINPRVPKWLSSTVGSCLQKDRNLRIQDGFILAKLLREKEKFKVISTRRNKGSLLHKIYSKDLVSPHPVKIIGKYAISGSTKETFLKLLILITSVVIVFLIWVRFGVGHNRSGNENEAYFQTGSNSIYEQDEKSSDTTSVSIIQQQSNIFGSEIKDRKNKTNLNSNSEAGIDLNEEIRKYIESGDRIRKEGLLKEAINKYQLALNLDSKNKNLKLKINETIKSWRESVIRKGKAYSIKSKYDSAIYIYESFRDFDKSDKVINNIIKMTISDKAEFEKRESLNSSAAMIEEGLHQLGIKMIKVESQVIGNYYIGESEVTQQLWLSVMGTNPSSKKGAMLPVENVSYNDTELFLSKLNQNLGLSLRLPTEKEWEYAASGGNLSHGYKYSGSNQLSRVAWYINNSDNSTHIVRGLEGNELGIYDMCGNVWEWCSSSVFGKRVIKGGSWLSTNINCSIDYKKNMSSDSKDQTTGFRICRSE